MFRVYNEHLRTALAVAFYAKPVESWLIVSNVPVTATMFPVGGVS